ncbi:MAG: hypothetical protein WHS87_00925 [Anaerolineales bacterium]
MRIFTSESQVPSDARSYILFNPETQTFTLTYQHLVGVDEKGQGVYERKTVELDPQGFFVNTGFRRTLVPVIPTETPESTITPSSTPTSTETSQPQIEYQEVWEPMPLSIHPPLAHDKNGRKIDLPVFVSQGEVFFVNPLTNEILRLEDYRPLPLAECQSLNEFWEKAPLIPLSAINDGTAHFAFFLNYPDLKDAEAPVYTNDRYATFKLSPTDKTAPIWYIPSDKISPFHYIWIEFNNIQDKAGENYRYAYFRQRILWEELPFGQPVLPYAFRVINPATGAKLWVAPQILYDPQNTQEAVDKPIDISDPKNVKILWVAADIANLRGDQIEFMLKVYPRFFPYNAKFTTERLGKAFTIFLTPIIYTDPKVFTDCDFVIFKSLRRDYSFSDFPGLEGLLELEDNNPVKKMTDNGGYYPLEELFPFIESHGWNNAERKNTPWEWHAPLSDKAQLILFAGVPYQFANTNLDLLDLEK